MLFLITIRSRPILIIKEYSFECALNRQNFRVNCNTVLNNIFFEARPVNKKILPKVVLFRFFYIVFHEYLLCLSYLINRLLPDIIYFIFISFHQGVSDLFTMIQILTVNFSEECPVFSRVAPSRSPAPYPTHGQPGHIAGQPPYPTGQSKESLKLNVGRTQPPLF